MDLNYLISSDPYNRGHDRSSGALERLVTAAGEISSLAESNFVNRELALQPFRGGILGRS